MGMFKERLSNMTREELEAFASEIMQKKNTAENTLDDVYRSVEKQNMALSELLSNYDIGERLDAYAAVSYIHGDDNSNLATKSAQWYLEYERIMWLINVAYDYGNRIIKDKDSYEREVR